MKKNFIFVVILALVFVSCSDQEHLTNPTTNSDAITFRSDYTPLTEEEINAVADLHNPLLDTTLSMINLQSENLEQEVIDVYAGFYDPEWGISADDYEASLNIGEDLLDSVLVLVSNPSAFLDVYNSIIIIGNSGNSYTEIVSDLDALKATIYSTLTDKDRDAALLMLETSKRSAYYWLPTTQDGSGIGYQILTDFWEDNELSGKPDFGKAMAVDGLGASFGFLLIGFLLAPTPVTLGALVLYVGLKAAEASIIYLIG